MGGVVMPPVPAFCTQPDGLADLVDHSVCHALDLFDIDVEDLPRWDGAPGDLVLGGRLTEMFGAVNRQTCSHTRPESCNLARGHRSLGRERGLVS
jgi:hypothetical protein